MRKRFITTLLTLVAIWHDAETDDQSVKNKTTPSDFLSFRTLQSSE